MLEERRKMSGYRENITDEQTEQVRVTLERIKKVADGGAGMSLKAIVNMASGQEKMILEAACDRGKLMELLPQEGLSRLNLLLKDGLPRLREESGKRWTQIITGTPENEMPEIYNYLRLVQIPQMAVGILLSMAARPEMEIVGLTSEQRADFLDLRALAVAVIKHTMDSVADGARVIAMLKIGMSDLQTCLRQDSF